MVWSNCRRNTHFVLWAIGSNDGKQVQPSDLNPPYLINNELGRSWVFLYLYLYLYLCLYLYLYLYLYPYLINNDWDEIRRWIIYIFKEDQIQQYELVWFLDAIINPADFRYKLYLENEDDEVGAVMETGSVEDENEEEENAHHGKENQRPNNQIGRFGIFSS